MKNLIILILVLLFILFFALAPPVYAADTITITAAQMIKPIKADVYHIIIETEQTNKVSTISGRLYNARIDQVFLWQIVNGNETKGCSTHLWEFECEFTADRLMPVEITISYVAPEIQSGCYIQPTSIVIEYEGQEYTEQNAILPVENYCLLLPMVKG
jgi:hypothetical protein